MSDTTTTPAEPTPQTITSAPLPSAPPTSSPKAPHGRFLLPPESWRSSLDSSEESPAMRSFQSRRGRLVPKVPSGPFNVVGRDAVSCCLPLLVTT